MLRETGRVVAVEDESVWVETIRKSTCGACAASKGCGHGLLERYASGQRGLIRVLPGPRLAPGDCRIDDQVMIELPEAVVLRGSFIVYALPLLTLLGGAAVPALAGASGDLPAALGAGGGLLAGLAFVRWHGWRHRDDRRLQPALAEIVERAAEPLALR
jgi:sigma-E factor negative regulatory protein RseC